MILLQAFFLGLGVFFIILILTVIALPLHFFFFLFILKRLNNKPGEASRKGKYLLILESLLITIACFVLFAFASYWFFVIYLFKE